tara:strand:- start:198 stop:506 length:309 start_codon:yes stop_codon:yes gene_type:complete
METPNLVEPGIKYYIRQTLRNCNNIKNYYRNVCFNIIVFIIFIIVVGGVLYYKYKGVMNITEKKKREEQKKKYILEQIQKMHTMQKNTSMDLITNLPVWTNQ